MKQSKHPNKSVTQWFLSVFTVMSVVFFFSLIPLLFHLNRTFSELQDEKLRQQLQSCSAEIESAVLGTMNASEALSRDPRLVPLRYTNQTDVSIPANILLQVKNSLQGFLLPLDLVNFGALQFDLGQNIVITKEGVFYKDGSRFYSNHFSVDGLTAEQWTQTLAENDSGFLPVLRVYSSSAGTYDALIFSTPWNDSSFLFVCLSMNEIKDYLISQPSHEGYFLTISRLNGEVLYNDWPRDSGKYRTITTRLSRGRIQIELHVSDSVFYKQMRPLYLFIISYCATIIVCIIFMIFAGTRITVKPVQTIIQLLDDNSDNRKPVNKKRGFHQLHPSQRAFSYITERIIKTNQELKAYQAASDLQRRLLKTRYFEKALNGQLETPKELQQFHLFFPGFPKCYHLALFRIVEQDSTQSNSVLYDDPLSILLPFLEAVLPHVYYHNISDSDLLMLASAGDILSVQQIISFIIQNIEEEEPEYSARCIISACYNDLVDLPAAYYQLQDSIELAFQNGSPDFCISADAASGYADPFTVTELLTIYTAIIYGNKGAAFTRIKQYSEKQQLINNPIISRHFFEMLRSMLICIKLEYPSQLINIQIPSYQANELPFDQLQEIIGTFCDQINSIKSVAPDSLAYKITQYIDEHYTDPNLCITELEEFFHCSSTTLRKSFKATIGVTVTNYIESKRMTLANELLIKNSDTVSEIALKCGFSSANSFYKAYRRVFGYAPRIQRDTIQ